MHTILLDGPEKSLAQCEIILQYIEIYRGKRPVSPYTMYAGVELFKFNIYFKNFKCQGGCYPGHGAPSDGHKTLDKYEKFKRVKNIIFFVARITLLQKPQNIIALA